MSYVNLDSVPTQTAGSSAVAAQDWNTYVRDNFDTLKRGHVRVANEAALAALAVAVGTMVFAEAEESLWVYGTSGWTEVAKLGNTGAVSDAAVPFLAPVGSLMPYGGVSNPPGWLLCEGQEILRASYAALDTVIGARYSLNGAYMNGSGGAGTTHFRVPDLRGRVAVGKGTHVDVDALGDSDGVTTVADRRPKHYHNISGTATDGGVDHVHGYELSQGPQGLVNGNDRGSRTVPTGTQGGFNTGGASAYLHTHPLSGTAGPTSSSPLDAPAFIVVNYIIKF